MKVAQILYSGLGGHGSVVFSLLDADRDRRWNNVLGFLGIEPLLPAYREKCERAAIPHAYFPAIAGHPTRSWPQIARWLRAEQPDAIVLHSGSAFPPCLLHARRFGVPLVFVEHQPNALKSRSEWLASRLGMLFADRVVVLTRQYLHELRHRLGWMYRCSKVILIPNGIDTTKFRPAGQREAAGAPSRVIGMAARFTTKKRQDLLVRALPLLVALAPEFDWKLSLAGTGETLEPVRALVREQGLEDRVTLTGHLDEDALATWFGSLDLYVHATEGETLSTSMLQALAASVPMLASDAPGVSNLIGGTSTCGVIVHPQEPQAFADAIAALARNPARAMELARQGRALILQAYSSKGMFAQYDGLVSARIQGLAT